MDFLGASLTKEVNDLAAGGSAEDGVIDEDDPLALNGVGYRIELDLNGIKPSILARRDKCPSDVLILDKADAVRDT